MYVREQNPIRILARPKRSLLGEHWGVQLPGGEVIHLTPEGVRLDHPEVFTEGKQWWVVREADPRRTHQIMWRVSAALHQRERYHLTLRNCEVFANELLGDPPESPQVQGLAVLAAIVLTLRVLA